MGQVRNQNKERSHLAGVCSAVRLNIHKMENVSNTLQLRALLQMVDTH